MTSISALSSVQAAVTPAAVSQPLASTSSQDSASVASTLAIFGAASSASNLTYQAPAAVSQPPSAAWEQDSVDPVTQLMRSNFGSTVLASRFDGLGSALLERLRDTPSSFSQSVLMARPGSTSLVSDQANLHQHADNQITLSIKTASGKDVTVKLASSQDGLAVSLEIADEAELSDEERTALADLSEGFQDAIDGISSQPPKVAVAGLMKFDSSVIKSIDLSAEVKVDGVGQSLELHADGTTRSLTAINSAGTVKVDVDLSQATILGKGAQRDAAVRTYLDQFERARLRGDGDAYLMGQFKDAFSALHSNYGNETPPDVLSRGISLSRGDQSMLSGMADFRASITQTSQSPNARLPQETDSFKYQASQSTTVSGENQRNRRVHQEQEASLNASYHRPLDHNIPMNLGDERSKQNYLYYQIKDLSKSSTDIAYRDGTLVSAKVQSTRRESTTITKVVNGKESNVSTQPTEVSTKKNLLSTLRAADRKAQESAGSNLREHLPLLIEAAYADLAAKAALARNP